MALRNWIEKQSGRGLVIALACLSFICGAGLIWWATKREPAVVKPTTDLAASQNSAPSNACPFQPRIPMDVSGFSFIIDSIPPWPPESTLQQISDAWKNVGPKQIEELDSLLKSETQADIRVDALMLKSLMCNYEGEPAKAYASLCEIRRLMDSHPQLAQQSLYTIIFMQGITSLRQGENDNCILCRGESSCILPIHPSAVHAKPEGSRRAIGHFTEYLQQFPDDLEVKWLLNIAHMTLGEFPNKIPPQYLVNIDPFLHSEFDIGRFRDIGDALGINRFNQAGGGILEDFDNDGWLDIVVTAMDPTQQMGLFRNLGNGKFEERTKQSGIAEQLGGLNCVQTDFNNDGNMDIFIPRAAWVPHAMRPTLLKNDGKGNFTDVTKQAGMLKAVNSNAACWADFDNDGFLDVFICCERQENLLYRNKGDGTFEEVAAKAGVQGHPANFCKGATWIDYDRDRYPDLFLNNLGKSGILLHNNRNGTFTDVTSSMGIDGPKQGFACWAWDFDNDGWDDIYATCYDRSLKDVVLGLQGLPHTRNSNKLFRNMQGKGFKDVAKSSGLDFVHETMGCNFGDFDNDGYLDMYLGTGEPNLSTLIPNRMIKNVGGLRFADISASSGTGHLQKGHGVGCGDWDRDGNVDIFIQMGGAIHGDKYHNIMFQNPGHKNSWITLKLVGTKSNRAAIGARIKITTDQEVPKEVYRTVSSGSSFGANPLEQTIGLGKTKKIASIEVYWPTSDTTQTFKDVDVNQYVVITENQSAIRTQTRTPITLTRN